MWGTVVEMYKRAGQVRVSSLVAAITLRAVTSLIPLVIVGVSVIGLLAQDNKELGNEILANLKLTDPEVSKAVNGAIDSAATNAGLALVISILGSLYLGLGIAAAIASAFDAVWQVPTRGLVDKLLGIPWLISAAIVFTASGFATTLILRYVRIPFVDTLAAFAGGGATGFLAVLLSYRILTNLKLPMRVHMPGAALAGGFLALFQILGNELVAQQLARSQGTYSALAGIFALFFIFNLFSNVLVYGTIANVVLWEKTHGTTQLVGRAPALPVDMYTELERGGQRPHPAKGSPMGRFAKLFIPARFK
jgi:uncharacterized BrkB/YihY/UPF0761 family membrane protein